MKLTFRWYGENDSIPLDYLEQIPNLSGVVTSVYDKKPGEVWDLASLEQLKWDCQAHNLTMEVIESIPVSEEIKSGGKERDEHIAAFKKNLELCAQVGVKCVCYNFMPVFDWLRTNLHHQNADGSNSLSYCAADFAKIDPQNLHLPGWDESYKPEELKSLLKRYQAISHERLFANLVYFLKAVIPTCEKVGIVLAIHPDDPPWDVFGLPRIVSNEKDLDCLLAAVPSKANGLTFCTGSLGAGRTNDLPRLAAKYAAMGRIHFAHLRNVRYDDNQGSFTEVGHYSGSGSLDMYAIVKALVKNGFNGYVRPDHGRNIFGEEAKPGYGLYDRALGCAYINGLFEAVEKSQKEK